MHVTAARRLISRYKGPGDKSAILACVNRKAKSLGCDSKKDHDINTSFLEGIKASVKKHIDSLFNEDNDDINLSVFVDNIVEDLYLVLAENGQFDSITLDDIPELIEGALEKLSYLKKDNKDSLVDIISTIVHASILTVINYGGVENGSKDA